MPRIAPLSPPYEPGVGDALTAWMGGVDKEPLLLFRTLLRNEELASRMRVLGAGLLAHGKLPAADRELVVARVCARSACRYEWSVHAAIFGEAVGFTADLLAATVTAPPDDPRWSPRQAALLGAADELHRTAALSDPAWQALAAHFDEDQILEFLVLCGWYRTVAYLANGLRLESEPWSTPYPGT
ncbi:carboxymuconolactone decarboxylase family protein [Streptodolium elevatio]|uniref:Carboxymuconolactone decarboxylase family protein n=1 Tax=Streptodolium elevatio TaxID=3157996 RepID=A0ABV3DLR6_9ACTN